MLKGVDVSKHNGVINWEKAKNEIDFAIIRCGFGMNVELQDDFQFKRNVEECIRLGIPFGVYLYSYANTIQKANSEAEHVLRLINPYKKEIKLNIWYDIEDSIQATLDKQVLSNIINTFCNKIEENGYSVGIYANKYWLETKIEYNIKNRYMLWCAGYGKNDGQAYGKYKYEHENVKLWQYTSRGSIQGIGMVDMNYLYDEKIIVKQEQENISNQKKEIIKKLQHAYNVSYQTNLVEDGIKGKKTEAVMKQYYLKNFTKNELVNWVQDRLVNHKHYYIGKSGIDGKYGKDTENAITLFQKDNGLTVDGKAGYDTISILI